MTTNALHSLYGPGHVNATRTRECVAMPGTRDQKVCTSPCIVDVLEAFWSQGIAYDPCHCEGSLIRAAKYTDTRGLIDPWPEFTFANPPYGESLFDPENEMELLVQELLIREERKEISKRNKGKPKDQREPLPKYPPGLPLKKANLGDWLRMQYGTQEVIMLVPNRTFRKWFRDWKRQLDLCVELNPLKFVGHDTAFPFPLVLGYTGRRAEKLAQLTKHLGDPTC